jgi:putative ABC transport system substrate-binding protein
LLTPANPATDESHLQVPAQALGLQLRVPRAGAERDFDAAFADLVQARVQALLIEPDAFFTSRAEHLAALTLQHAIPAAYQFRQFASAGGLMSYDGNVVDSYRQLGVYVGRILNGQKPADLPVVQSSKVEFILNLKTAKALGLTVPITLLGRADEVIE